MSVTVEEVRRADQRRRFHELGRVLFAAEPRWAPVLRTYEAWLFERGHPYRQRAEVVRFLARRDGDVVGRVCAHHVEGSADGWFGAFECAGDAAAVAALVGAARDWVRHRGARTLVGPATFTLADEAGVLVEGFEHPGGTARPWHPPWYAEHLAAAGLGPLEQRFPRWRLPAATADGPSSSTFDADVAPTASNASTISDLDDPVDQHGERSTRPETPLRPGGPMPPHAGRLGDRRLALTGPAGTIAAVPDISAGLRSTSLRRARRQVAAATEAAVVRLEGDPSVLVPALLAAAAAAGYAHVWSPWCADADRPPDTIHRLLGSAVAFRN